MSAHSFTCTARRCLAAVFSGLSLAAITGCGYSTDLRINDHSAMGHVRVVKRLGTGRGGVELDAAQVRGSGQQSLTALEQANLGAASINGPATLQQQARVQQVQLAYNHLMQAGEPVELEWLAGVARVRMNWDAHTLAPPAQSLSLRDGWSGPALGLVLRARLSGPLAAELRMTGAARVWGAVQGGASQRVELVLAARPVENLVLRMGVADSRTSMRPMLGYSEVTLRNSGPFVGLGLEF